MKCPKCGYARTAGDTAPDWQCPSCGVAYAKAGPAASPAPRAAAGSRAGGAWLTRVMPVVFAVAVAWAVLPGKREAPLPQNVLAQANIVMYSLTTCGYCNAKRAQLTARGIPFVEYFIDNDKARQNELFEKLIKAGYRGGGIGTPTFEVNGKMLPNNPSLETIIQNL